MSKHVAFFAVALLAIGAGNVAAGEKKDSQQQRKEVFQEPNDEAKLAHEIRHELVMLPYYGIFDDLAFRVDGGKVTLFGATVRPTLKSSAENVVKKIDGVTSVDNQIKVLPLSPMDDQIRRATYRAIYGDSMIGTRYGFRALPSIHIIVENGNITLTGMVATEGDKNLIGIRARQVPNAFSVTNNLVVESSLPK